MKPLVTRSRSLTPAELAIETGALLALRHDMNDWPDDTEAARIWHNLVAGLQSIDAIGYAITTNGYVIVYEEFPDDDTYFALAGDGKGDLFTASRQNWVKTFLFTS